MTMVIINFSHPLTPEHVAAIEALSQQAASDGSRQTVARVLSVPSQFNLELPLAPQVVALADACALTPAEWQNIPLLIVPPSLNFASVLLLAELHGRMGYFPSCVRLRPVAGATPPRYEVAEILALQEVRDEARTKR